MKLARFVIPMVAMVLALHGRVDAATILPGTVQTFDDPHGWVIGVGPGPATPAAVPTALGGPGGALDPYLLLQSTGTDGPGSRLSAQNFNEWAGDYLTGGVDVLEMDVRNFGINDVTLRLLFVEFAGMAPVNAAISGPILVPGLSDWDRIAFDIRASALTALIGSAAGALSNTSELRLVHSPSPVFIPGSVPAIAATVGVDNITATAPEPATWLLLGAGALVSARRFRARGKI